MLESPKVLITDVVHPLLIEGLAQAGYQCNYQPKITLEKVLEQIVDYQGIVINSKIIVDQSFLDKASKLEFIARLGSGLEIIDLEYAEKKGVLVHRSPDGNCDAVAEHALGMLLNLAIKLRQADQQVRKKIWKREANRGWELMNKTIGLIGFGFTAKALAKRLQGFGMKVLAYDKYLSKGYAKDFPWLRESSLEQLLADVDILSLHLPLSEENKGYVNQEFLMKLEQPTILLNTSRGAVVDTQSLIWGLDNGIITAAGLDVFENEKPLTYTEKQAELFKNLFKRENVILSPHVAGWTIESKERLSKLLLERILTKADRI
jgi:D-3-phosphoglycerate dehydrogenase